MDEATAKKLQESVDALTKQVTDLTEENKTLKEDNSRKDEVLGATAARTFVEKKLSDVKGIPDATKERLTESLSASPIMKDGKLDEDAMEEAITSAVKKEAQYLSSLGFGKVTDLGESRREDDDDEEDRSKLKGRLEESFKTLGFDGDKLKTAVEGR